MAGWTWLPRNSEGRLEAWAGELSTSTLPSRSVNPAEVGTQEGLASWGALGRARGCGGWGGALAAPSWGLEGTEPPPPLKSPGAAPAFEPFPPSLCLPVAGGAPQTDPVLPGDLGEGEGMAWGGEGGERGEDGGAVGDTR